jgi:1-acyl-sn-glycerol-3-phosphate acyltransferase
MVMWTALAGAGLSILLLASIPSHLLSLALAFFVGLFGNIVIVSVTSLLQRLSPNYIRGRIMGVNALTNTAFSVLTYLAIWRMPHADEAIIGTMWTLGIAIGVFGIIGLLRHMGRGPMPTRRANGLWRIGRWFCRLWHRAQWIDAHHVPPTGPIILAANHTTGLDPFLMQTGCRRLVRWVMIESYRFRVLNFLWNAIDPIVLQEGSGNLGQVRAIVDALKRDDVVGLFPEGQLQRDHRELQKFRAGVGMIARRSGAVVVPVWISGTPQTRNMLWHFLRPSRSRIRYGKPFTPDKDASHEQITEQLRERMLELADVDASDARDND